MPEFILQNICLRSSDQDFIISWREWSVALILGHFVLWELQHQSCGTFCSSVHLGPLGSNTYSVFFLLKFLGYLNMVIWSPDNTCMITFRKSWVLLIWAFVSLLSLECAPYSDSAAVCHSCLSCRCKGDICFFVYRFFSSPSFPSLSVLFERPPCLAFPSPILLCSPHRFYIAFT